MRIDPAAALARLRTHQTEFERMGVRHLALFGSQVRGEAGDASDVDIAVVFDEAARAEGLAAILAAEVDLPYEAMQRPIVRASYEADRVYAF